MGILYKRFKQPRTVFCALFACFCLLIAGPVAAVESLYTVENVRVDVTAENALAARDQAFAKAQGDAFRILAERMLTESEAANYVLPDTSVISSFIQDYEITKEKLSSVRYIGTYTFRFKERAVQQHFSGRGMQYTDVSSKPVLLLPFFQRGNQTLLWSPYNVWMTAWSRAQYLEGLVPVVVPLGDLQDVRDIGEDQALSYDVQGLSRMLSRYGAGEAVLAVAIPDGNLALVDNDRDPATGALTINIYRTDRSSGPEHVQQIIVTSRSGQTRAMLYNEAAQKVHAALQKDWKQKTVVSAAQSNRLQVRVPFKNLQEWSQTQRTLKRVAGITELAVKSLSPRKALVDIYFQGSEERLRLALQQADMTLSQPSQSPQLMYQNANVPGAMPVYELYLNRYGGAQASPDGVYNQRF